VKGALNEQKHSFEEMLIKNAKEKEIRY